MSLKKYFWSLSPRALREIAAIFKNPRHPKYLERAFALLSRCDRPKEVFAVIKRQQFKSTWPRLKRYWSKTGQTPDFLAWWDAVYDRLLDASPKGRPAGLSVKIGKIIKARRLKKKISQSDFARLSGMSQPDISAIEAGKKNVTLETLLRLCKLLDIKNLPFA